MGIELHGFQFSVYAWMARFALAEKGVGYAWVEVNPFADDVPDSYRELHPFCRVPTLVHDGFALYETAAITRYVDEAFAGPSLQPDDPQARARMTQVVGIVDSYAYWPLVRQVFSHGIFGPRIGRPSDPAEVREGLAAAPMILAALEALAAGGDVLTANRLSLADTHLAPVMSYFAEAKEARALLADYSALAEWWSAVSDRPAFRGTKPQLP